MDVCPGQGIFHRFRRLLSKAISIHWDKKIAMQFWGFPTESDDGFTDLALTDLIMLADHISKGTQRQSIS
jgi:hypothetical protein